MSGDQCLAVDNTRKKECYMLSQLMSFERLIAIAVAVPCFVGAPIRTLHGATLLGTSHSLETSRANDEL